MGPTVYDPKEVEKEVSKFWKKEKVPDRIVSADPKKKKFYLLDGPPYVNADPHVGHAKTTTLKDVWGKFKHMQGFSVWFQPGFDCGGLPIENKVEKKLGLNSKRDIEKIGIDKFIDECDAFARGNEKTWLEIYRKLGAWRGWLEPYLTSENYYIESGWWTVKKMYEKGLLAEGEKPGFWCPHCETVLSGYEVTDSYKNVEDPSVFIKFKVAGKDEFLLVWTTTPWTLPANVAICVHPEETYLKAEVGGEVIILAEKRLQMLVEMEKGYKVLKRFPGKDLEGTKYVPLLDIPIQHELVKDGNAHMVIVSVPLLKKRVASKIATKKEAEAKEEFGHIVDMESGSGLVHIAPGHGDVDNKIGKHYGLPDPSPVDEKGHLTADAGKFGGMYVKKANAEITEYLNEAGLLFYPGKIVHSYPLCWRCKTPLIYRKSRQWFLKIDTLKHLMMKENEKVNWLPEFARERFRSILMDAPDWPITRQRYWGIPMPVWECGKCGSKKVIGSVAELRKESAKGIGKVIDLHKNFVDRVELECGCGSRMTRIADIMDVWFDSSISPWASLGYPFRNKALFEKMWPVDLIDESQDQVRGWFYYLMLSGFGAFGEGVYKTVCLNGWVLDDKAEKMSKSLGNIVTADNALEELGADPLRLYLCHDVAPWDTQKFSMKNAKEMQRALNILWNTHAFAKTYAGFQKGRPSARLPEDKWMLSRVNSLVIAVTEDMENFRFHSAARSMVNFILNDLSRWYVKLVRDRSSPWHKGKDKVECQKVLSYSLDRLLRMMAPITPFVSERLYADFGKSVHESGWPKAEGKMVDTKLERRMSIAKAVVEAMNSARQEEKVKLRWPLVHVAITSNDKETVKAVMEFGAAIMEMGNAKKILHSKAGKMRKFEGFEIGLGKPDMEDALIRELTRKIQVLRKEKGMHVKEQVELWLYSDEKTIEVLKKHGIEIRKDVGAKALHMASVSGKKEDVLDFDGKIIGIKFARI